MTTLLATYRGKLRIGRCDAHCYNARLPECECICQGRNHGVGLTKAIRNTPKIVRTVSLEEGLRLYVRPVQLPLPLAFSGQDKPKDINNPKGIN